LFHLQKNLPFMADTMTAEAYAFREGLLLSQHMGCNRFTIQSDNSDVVHTMKDGGFSATAVAAIFYDCNILISGFAKVLVEHCPRKANVVAHELAQFCFRSSSLYLRRWFPSFLLSFLIKDVTVFDIYT
jgi:hypothetical protein